MKRAILLFFATTPNVARDFGPFEIVDRVPLKTGLEAAGWARRDSLDRADPAVSGPIVKAIRVCSGSVPMEAEPPSG